MEIQRKCCNYARKEGQSLDQKGGEKSYKWHMECNNYSDQG